MIYRASDYMVDRALAGDGPLRGATVSSAAWDTVLLLATDSQSLAVGLAVQDAGLFDIAANAYYQAARNSPIGRYDFAHTMALHEDLERAEAAFRGLSAAGDTNATVRLANLLSDQGRDSEAKLLYQGAARAENLRAEARMALLYGKHGGGAERDEFYRRAADDGDTDAMVAQARRATAQDVESLYRRAADAGNIDAIIGLSLRLIRKGRTSEAQEYFERAGRPFPLP
ncbi:MAG: hypothetical protein GEV28_16385 [Actinophytocola sp.]|uniref:hypothetical protein n=1 Tax=Actinophytocola sp. TaxID=1872138 RepID=UPI001326B618|nr:hypothetical protein [Actinophytocola sp.]MPZ81877.1 hypothetical protein [Actinophytocola sp.]